MPLYSLLVSRGMSFTLTALSARTYSVPFAGIPNAAFGAESYSRPSQVAGDTLTLAGDTRLYLLDGRKKRKLDLRGRELRFTADVSGVPCSCNAAVYLVGMTGGYCDIQTSNWCTELDLFEANEAAVQATVHTRRGKGGDGTCNQWGCAVNWGNFPLASSGGGRTADLFGRGARLGIDSRRPFGVAASLSAEGELVVRLSQDNRTLTLLDGASASNPVVGSCDGTGGGGSGDGGGGCDGRDPPNPGPPTGLTAAALAASAAASAQGLVLVLSLWGRRAGGEGSAVCAV